MNGITHQRPQFPLKSYHKKWCYSEGSIEPRHNSQQITLSSVSHPVIEGLNAVHDPISYLGAITLP